jgi:polysaccharide export outer membrane protein
MDLRVSVDRGLFRTFISSGRRATRAVALCSSVFVAACTALPADGPAPHQVVHNASAAAAPYLLVKLTPDVVSRAGEAQGTVFSSLGGSGPGASPQIMLGVGDVISVTIFEAAAGGLFIPSTSGARPGNFVTLPDQNVDNSGNITMPYAGTIRAAGRSIPDIQQDIVSRLKDRAIEPQVVISLKEQRATEVSVLGAVNASARLPINPSGDRLLDVIAKAGGPQFPAHETYVTLQRGKREATEPFSRLVDHPTENVYVRAGDIVVLARRPETFVALGASGKNDQFDFGAATLTLAEAIGKSGGLLDERANATFVFLYREEDRSVLEKLGYNTINFATDMIPTIYTVDVRDPSGYFLASKFDVHDKDVLFIANAASVDISKAFSFIREAAATGRDTQLIQ